MDPKRKKLIRRKSSLRDLDSVQLRRKELDNEDYDRRLLQQAEALWVNLAGFRARRARNVRFLYKDQWGDTITVNGKTMTEREYLVSQGNYPYVSNQISHKVATISGIITKEQYEPVASARDRKEQQYGELFTECLQANGQVNEMNTLFENALTEYLTGGCAILRETYEWRNGREDSWTDIVNPNFMFFDSAMRDPRLTDVNFIGEIHDITFNELCTKFVTDPSEYDVLKEIYVNEAMTWREADTQDINEKNNPEHLDFREPSDRNYCRVYEIWKKESRAIYRVHDMEEGTYETVLAEDKLTLRELERINKEREATNRERLAIAKRANVPESEVKLLGLIDYKDNFQMESYWYCRFLAPDATVLWEGESPFPDHLHPYSLVATPLIDGLMVGLVSQSVDTQKGVNRALVMNDWQTRAGLKGVTMVPKTLVPKEMDYNEFAEQWTSMDGMIFYEPKAGLEPKQYFPSARSFDAAGLIKLLTSLDDTFVTGAMEGKTPYSGTSATLYQQQTLNSSTPIASLLDRFRNFMNKVNTKKLKYIIEWYDEKRLFEIAGNVASLEGVELDLTDVGHVEFDLKIRQGAELPTLRAQANDYLLQFFNANAITLEDVLKCGDFQFADTLLQSLQARQQQVQQMGMPPAQPGAQGDVNPAIAEQAAQQGPPAIQAPRPLIQ